MNGKHLFLTSAGLTDKMKEKFFDIIGKCPKDVKVLYIPTAGIETDGARESLAICFHELFLMGIQYENIFVYPNQCKPGFNAGMIVRYLLEKCRNVSEAVSCLYQLPIASAQTLTLADTMGAIAVIECNAEQIKIEKTLNSNIAFVCATNTFHLPGMVGYNNDKIDNWFAEERYQTLYSAFSEKNGGFNFPFAEKLLSGDYGFLCQYDRSTGKDTVWSVIYDMKRHKIYRSEGNPRRHKFKEDIRFQF